MSALVVPGGTLIRQNRTARVRYYSEHGDAQPADSQPPGAVRRLQERVAAAQQQGAALRAGEDASDALTDPATRARLEALGYIE